MEAKEVIKLIETINEQPEMFHFNKFDVKYFEDGRYHVSNLAKLCGLPDRQVILSLEDEKLTINIPGQSLTMNLNETVIFNDSFRLEKVTPCARYREDHGPVFTIENFFREIEDILIGDVEFSYVSSEGGREGEGDYMEVVFKANDKLFRVTGHYNSYDDNEWYTEDIVEVRPKEVTVTVYEPVNSKE